MVEKRCLGDLERDMLSEQKSREIVGSHCSHSPTDVSRSGELDRNLPAGGIPKRVSFECLHRL
jgi:hypothetical protein